jgi:hypothetical protein
MPPRKRQHRHRKVAVRVSPSPTVAHLRKTRQFALKRNAYGVKQIDAAKKELQEKINQSPLLLPLVRLIRIKKNAFRKIVFGAKQIDAVRNAFLKNKITFNLLLYVKTIIIHYL